MFRYLLALFIAATASRCGGYRERGASDPAREFEALTGLVWPESAKVIEADDSHLEEYGTPIGFGPGVLDGELFIVFDADKETVGRWAAGAAPWGAGWQMGPVPEKILGRSRHVSTLDSSGVTFAAQERGSGYWDGDLLMIDRSSGRVWLSSWDK